MPISDPPTFGTPSFHSSFSLKSKPLYSIWGFFKPPPRSITNLPFTVPHRESKTKQLKISKLEFLEREKRKKHKYTNE